MSIFFDPKKHSRFVEFGSFGFNVHWTHEWPGLVHQWVKVRREGAQSVKHAHAPHACTI